METVNASISPREEKAMMRADIQAKRDKMAQDKAYKKKTDEKLIDRFTSLVCYRFAEILLIYSPIKNEVDVNPLIEKALADGKKVALPCCLPDDHTMIYRFITDRHSLVRGACGVPEPEPTLEAYDPRIDCRRCVCVVPALAFDREGYRLGYGGGYYDRFLPRFKGTSVGLIPSGFLLPRVPRSRYDSRVDVLITEKEVSINKNEAQRL